MPSFRCRELQDLSQRIDPIRRGLASYPPNGSKWRMMLFRLSLGIAFALSWTGGGAIAQTRAAQPGPLPVYEFNSAEYLR